MWVFLLFEFFFYFAFPYVQFSPRFLFLTDSRSTNGQVTNGVGLILDGSPESRPMPCDPSLSFGLLTNFQADHLLMNKHTFEANQRASSPESSYNDIVHNLSVTSPNFRISNSVHHPDLHFNGLDPQGIPVPIVTASTMISTSSSDESQNVSSM